MPEQQPENSPIDPTRPWFDQVPWDSTPDEIFDSAREYYSAKHPNNSKLAGVLADIDARGVLQRQEQLESVRNRTLSRLPPEVQRQIGFISGEGASDQQDSPNPNNADDA